MKKLLLVMLSTAALLSSMSMKAGEDQAAVTTTFTVSKTPETIVPGKFNFSTKMEGFTLDTPHWKSSAGADLTNSDAGRQQCVSLLSVVQSKAAPYGCSSCEFERGMNQELVLRCVCPNAAKREERSIGITNEFFTKNLAAYFKDGATVRLADWTSFQKELSKLMVCGVRRASDGRHYVNYITLGHIEKGVLVHAVSAKDASGKTKDLLQIARNYTLFLDTLPGAGHNPSEKYGIAKQYLHAVKITE